MTEKFHGKQTQKKNNFIFLHRLYRKDNEALTHGVIGNTTDFGSEESRFEP